MSKILIQNAQIIMADRITRGDCLIEEGKIVAVGDGDFCVEDAVEVQKIDAAGSYLAAGLIDLQLNGAFGLDFTDNPETIWEVAAKLPSLGLTGFLPTIITAPLAKPQQAQAVLSQMPPKFAGTVPFGLHLEGPFLHPEKKGAHNPIHILSPANVSAAEMADWTAESGVRVVTLAPEIEGALPLIEQLTGHGVVVSAGHSMATLDEAHAGFSAGIRYVTHLFNAMPPLHHREPGLVAAALADESVTIGLIPDGIHVHPDLVGLVWQMASGRINGVTDAMAAMGATPGNYQLGDYVVTVTEVDARLPSGTLAGSIVRPLEVIKNLVCFTGCSLVEAVGSMTFVPADLLGMADRKGRIRPGNDADLILFDAGFKLEKTFIQGSIVYD